MVFAWKPATFGPKLHVSMGPRTHLWFSACKTPCLASELLVSMGPVLICGFCIQNSDFWNRITNLYGSQTSPVVLCMYDSVISTRITRLYGFQPSSVVLCIQNSDLMTRIACVYGSQTSPVVFCMQNSDFWTRITSLYGSQTSVLCIQNSVPQWSLWVRIHKSLWVPDMTFRFVHVRQRD